jgi:hypothetical protein
MKIIKKVSELNEKVKIEKHFLDMILEIQKVYKDGESESIEGTLGGDLFFIEEREDLKEIPVISHGKRVTILDKPDCFDDVRIYDDFVIIFLGTNNEGGPTWIVPKHIAIKEINLRISLELTGAKWPWN